MKHLRVVLVACVALITISSADDSQPSEEAIERELLKELVQESVVLQDQETPGSQVSALKYITCDGNTWSCEDCNTKRLCLESWWYTGVTYYQCPTWAPYCTSSSSFAWCTATSTPGCTGETTTARASSTTAATPGG